MIALVGENIADLARWITAGAVVVCAHGAIATALVRWHEPVDAADTSGAIVVEFFAPDVRAAPPQQVQDFVPDRPVEKVEKVEEQKPEANGEEQIEQKVEPKPPEEQPREEIMLTTPPSEVPPEQTSTAPALGQSKPKLLDQRKRDAWANRISALLEGKKRYPSGAQARREQGTALVFFALDLRGRVTESHIVRSSGAPDLDAAALDLLRRIERFPPPPEGTAEGDHVDLTVPIRFTLK